MKGLIDSNVMIYLAKGLVDVGDLIQRYDEMLISRITHMEVLGFPFPKQEHETLVRELVDQFNILEINSQVGEATISMRKKNRIKLPDAIICATALVNNCELVTANVKDFKGVSSELTLYNPLAK